MKRLTGILFSILLIPFAGSGDLAANQFHPEFPILDASGRPAVLSGRPMSTMQTCGACHDTAFIENSSDHAAAGAAEMGNGRRHHEWAAGPGYFGGWDPLRYDSEPGGAGAVDVNAWLKRYGSRHVGGGPVGELVEMNCLMCHSDLPDHGARAKALSEGDTQWANSAPLSERAVLLKVDGRWQWNPYMFQPDGSLNEGLLSIRKPRDENCAHCHGQVSTSLESPLTVRPDAAGRSMTDRTGQIISPQKVSNSGLNIAGKETLTHAFDVHADRVVGCVNCHYSLNNPVYFQQRRESLPAHLDFDPRRLTSADYLERPLHQFAKGSSTHGLASPESENSLRRCESCHDAGNVHQWLPKKKRHFASLACESCHVPKIYGPALKALDWTLVDRDGQPQRHYREVEGDPTTADSLIHGFRPAMLARENVGGERKLAPFNLVSSWYWLAGEPARPVKRQELVDALYLDGRLHPDLVEVLDRDGDGRVTDSEFRLDSGPGTEAVRRRLKESGLVGVRIAGEITPFPISHNVVNGQWATRDCRNCHGADSVLAAPITLSDYLPGGLLPLMEAHSGAGTNGLISRVEGGGASFTPDASAEGYYILGLGGLGWVDLAGVVMFLGITLGVTVHAVARFVSSRRRPQRKRATRRMHMYDAYERVWHWLQAGAILMLIFTGLIIHKPHIFGIFSFAYVVRVHNVLGFILLINAALALFYTLASGTIRRFLPDPDGFFGRAIEQAMFYSKGIFAGEGHPLEKTKQDRLNPLQQITYLAILNILLPAQVITGVLIWGMQEWPHLAAALGGLPVLAPVHTFLAWAFSAFIVMHVYLTTTGETPLSGIKSMVSGWEDVEQHERSTGVKVKEKSPKEASHV
jgi:thiosulfate reductase cytochrome b subunit